MCRTTTSSSERVSPARLEAFASSVFRAIGATEATARRVAAALVDSDLAGHPSHGVLRMREYLEEVRAGRIDPRAYPRVRSLAPAVRLVDGEWGFGAVAMEGAVEEGRATAKEQGVAAVAIVRTNHIGRLGRWVERLAGESFAALLLASYANGPWEVAPFGGVSPALSTNPIAFAFPRSAGAPIVGDFATAATAWGKLELAQREGKRAPVGILLDRQGRPTRDIASFMQGGAIRVFGGHKGFALSLMVELFASALTSARNLSEGRKLAQAGLLLVFSTEALAGASDVAAARAREIALRVTAARPEKPAKPVIIPGDPEEAARGRNRNGISLTPSTLAELRSIADELELEPPA